MGSDIKKLRFQQNPPFSNFLVTVWISKKCIYGKFRVQLRFRCRLIKELDKRKHFFAIFVSY